MLPTILPRFLVDDPSRILLFLGGYMLARPFDWLLHKLRGWKDPLNDKGPFPKLSPFWLVIIVTISLNLYIAAQTQQAYSYTKKVAQDNQVCWHQFAVAINARSVVTGDNDRLFLAQSRALSSMLHDMAFASTKDFTPDEQIKALQFRAAQAYGVIDQVTNKLTSNNEERSRHPTSDPDCGK